MPQRLQCFAISVNLQEPKDVCVPSVADKFVFQLLEYVSGNSSDSNKDNRAQTAFCGVDGVNRNRSGCDMSHRLAIVSIRRLQRISAIEFAVGIRVVRRNDASV